MNDRNPSTETGADAKPDYEYDESRAKAAGVVKAIELAVKQAAWP